MPKNYASGVKEIRRAKSGKFRKLIVLIAIIAFLLVFGEIFSSIIKYGTLAITTSASTKSFSLYALSMGKFDTHAEAQNLANEASVQGAGGYVWNSGDKYYVLASIYPSNQDALSVANGISGYVCEVVELKYKKTNLNSVQLDDDKAKIMQSLNFLQNLYYTMYDNCLNLDTKAISAIACSNNVNYLKSQAKAQVVSLMQLEGEYKIGSAIVNTYISVIDSLDSCTNKLLQTSNGGYVAKFALCEITCLHQKLVNSL